MPTDTDRANWFIALPVAARQLPRAAMDELPPGTRAFHPLDLHVTVAFLGAVGEARALRAWTALEQRATAPIDAAIGPRATFGNPRRPSALGLDLDADRPDSGLAGLIAAWRDPLRRAADVAAEERPVRPHVTLGRPPRRPNAAWWRACRRWLATSDAPASVHLDRIALYTRASPDAAQRFRAVRTVRWTDSAHGDHDPG